MWPFKKKQPAPPQRLHPQLQDQALFELSEMVLHHPADPTPGSDSLDAAKFDYSLKSLAAMDEHLERMRTLTLSAADHNRFILRAGAYVGEVIRRHTPAPREWHWLDFDQAAAVQPTVASLGKNIGTAAILWDGDDGVIFPLAKVGKYLQNGSEDSLRFYAQVLVAGQPTQG